MALYLPSLGSVENVPCLDIAWGRDILKFVGDRSSGAGTELF